MTTLLYAHDSAARHDTGPGHPECADRYRAVMQTLDTPSFAALERRESPVAAFEQLARIHRKDYITTLLESVPARGYARIDPDTTVSPGSAEAALRAVGAAVAAVDAVMAGEARSAFCAVRPPGHHAEPARGMGFCVFNNVAVAAAHAREVHQVERVAIVDFDVHHGNGTQAAFWSDPSVLYASTHEYPFYPGTGADDERGQGNIFNVPLASMSGSAEFRRGIERTIFPGIEAFGPDLLLVSAGFDAHARDPLSSLRLDEEDFAWITRKLVDLAGEYCDGRIVSTLEGGYDLTALSSSVSAHVAELMRG